MRTLLERAFFAYARDRYKRSPFDKLPAFFPDYDTSGTFVYNARKYLMLRGPQHEVLAVYRIRPHNGTLRRLFLYPPGLNETPTGDKFYRKINEETV